MTPHILNHNDIRRFYETHPGSTQEALVEHLVHNHTCDKCPEDTYPMLCPKCEVYQDEEDAKHGAVCVSKTFDECDGCKTAMQALDSLCACCRHEDFSWYEDMRLVIRHIEKLHEQIRFMSNDPHREQVQVK